MRRPLRAALTGAALLGLLAGAIPPGRVHAAEREARYITHDAVAAVTADIDDDGAREVIVVTDSAGEGVRLLQVWDHRDGAWRSLATEVISRPGEDGRAALLQPADEALALLAWRDGSREHALLTVGGDAGDYGGGCCLALGSVGVDADGIAVDWLDAPRPRVEQVVVLDADADGADELLVVEPPDGSGDRHAHLLRWDGERFDGSRTPLGRDDSSSRAIHVGETDGVVGDEGVFAVDGGRRLLRMGLEADGTLLAERGAIGDAPELHLWSWGAGGGSIVVQVGTELRVVRWPRGGDPTTTAQAFRPEYPQVAVLGDGASAVVLDRGVVGFDPRSAPNIHVLSAGLDRLAVVRPTDAVDRLWELANVTMPALRSQLEGLRPYIGPFPGRLAGGEAAYLSAGNLITVDPAGRLRVRPMSSLTGLQPLGIAGPDGAWWVLDDGHLGRPDSALLVVNSLGTGTVSVVPEEDVLEPDDPRPLTVGLQNAALTDGGLLVADGGFDVSVGGPAGSLVLGVVDQWVVQEGVLPDDPVAMHLESLRRLGGNQPIEAAVVRIDPAGRVSAAAWEGEVRRRPPEVTAMGETRSFAGRAVVTGRASPDAAVLVDGEPVTLDEGGAFEVEVDAPIWPRDVPVVARDALGNETALRTEVVGFIDYRGVPWAAVVGLATVAAGLVLFLRTPRVRRAIVGPSDDARLEELDADPAESDTLSPVGRPSDGRALK